MTMRLVVWATLGMVLVTPEVAKTACNSFALGLKHLVGRTGTDHVTRACLTCDRLLEWDDDAFISKSRLKSLQSKLSGENPIFRTLHRDIKEYYTYERDGTEPWMAPMFLSPRGVFDPEEGFACCQTCCKQLNTETKPNRVKLPRYAIATGNVIGGAPPELTELNEVELALVSLARLDKHVFTFYGGAHKSMRGWHNLYENDVEHIAGVLQQLEQFQAGNLVACVLQGPFTSFQLNKVREQTTVRPGVVLQAMWWLKHNNRLYKDIKIPTAEELPRPIIIDDSEHVESENTDIESRFEYTVVFPGTEEINDTNGGQISQEEFKRQVIDSMDMSTDATLISRPTQHRLKDYEGDALFRAFPLQFPYGYGPVIPPSTSSKVSTQDTAKVKAEYLCHLQRLSIREMQRGDFILVLHNMYERQRAVRIAYLRCLHKVGEDSIAEHFANMTIPQLQSAINRAQSHLPLNDSITHQLLRSIDAVCKNMGHSNDAAKSARLKMFANTVRFGQGSIFFTVTPDDGNSFRIQIYVLYDCKDPPKTSDDLKDIDADFEMTHKMRQDFPGFCAFDFDQITALLIEHVLGWDQKKQQPKPEGGAFGILDAWSVAVEEQGRKTLHGHWILWLRNWSSLLKGLRSTNVHARKKAAIKLRAYIDTVLSTRLFGHSERLVQQAYKHDCVIDAEHQTIPTICKDQDIRNLRYQHGESEFGDDNFLQCSHCGKVFNMDELVSNVLIEWFGTSHNLHRKLRLAVKRYSAQVDEPGTAHLMVMRDFMIHALNNLHASTHVRSCFKKGLECRNKIPDRPCPETMIHFDEERKMVWWSWDGTKDEHAPFLAEPERHVFDIFMNKYHSRLSTILGCNTNIQCGIDGGHIMYATYYASKGTQAEDKLAYCQVAKTLYARMRRQSEAENDPNTELDTVQAPTLFSEGYRRLLSAVLSHTKGHVVSAPMAWFIMRRDSRFLFSNEFAYVCLDGILGRRISSRVLTNPQGTFLENKIQDYIFRPAELDQVNLYDFVMHYDVKNWSKKNEDDMMEFLEDHPQSRFRGVLNRTHDVTPLVSYFDFPDSSDFDGNILDADLEPSICTEQYAKSVLCLFVPFRDATLFGNQDPDIMYTHQLRTAMERGTITSESKQRLQHIQDCRNMMKAGRQKDGLERSTEALPDPISCKKNVDEQTEAEIDRHINECMTEIVSGLDEDNHLVSGDDIADHLRFISLTELRGHDKNQNGYTCLTLPSVESDQCIYKLNSGMADDGVSPARQPVTFDPGFVSKSKLTRLSLTSIRRNVESITALEHINPNGSVGSIQTWARIAFHDSATDEVDLTQQRAFEVIVAKFVQTFHDEADSNELLGTTGNVEPYSRGRYVKLRNSLKALAGMRQDDGQLIMFLTGAGGSGKTQVINSVLAYAKGFCQGIEYVFDKRMIVVTAMSGVAATLINGETVHSAAHLNASKITVDDQKEWAITRMIIIDEISFANCADILNLHEKLCLLKETVDDRYGGLHVIFTGDFSQLEPVGGDPLYHQPNFAPWHDWINCYIELTGEHRFRNDPEFGRVLKRIREGRPTPEDIAYLNTRIINGDHPHAPTMADVPNNVAYAVYRNVDRTAINNGIFAEHIKQTHSSIASTAPPNHTIIVRSDEMTWKSNRKPVGANAKRTIWAECNDTDVTTGGGKNKKFVDTFLKLYLGIPLMYTENTDVANGQANGTLCYLVHVQMREHVTENDFELMNIDGMWVQTVDASNVEYLLCRFANSDRTFKVCAQMKLCQIRMPIELIPGEKMHHTVSANILRFPILPNNCTTGHKLQGQTKESLFIRAWYKGKNWPYVVLSRVKQLSGLFLSTGIDLTFDFSLDPRLVRMLTNLKRKQPNPYEPEET